MNICIKDLFFLFWTLNSSLINCLCGELFILSAGGGLCFDMQWKVVRKFCSLCYKQFVIALSPRIIGDKFSLVFSKFSQILWQLWKCAWGFILNSTRPHAITITLIYNKKWVSNLYLIDKSWAESKSLFIKKERAKILL